MLYSLENFNTGKHIRLLLDSENEHSQLMRQH